MPPQQMARRPDIQEVLNSRKTQAPAQIKGQVDSDVHALVHARYLDSLMDKSGRPGSNVAQVKDDIYKQCKESPEYAKEWKATTEHMYAIGQEIREKAVFTDGEPKHKVLDAKALEKAEKLAELAGNMQDAHNG